MWSGYRDCIDVDVLPGKLIMGIETHHPSTPWDPSLTTPYDDTWHPALW